MRATTVAVPPPTATEGPLVRIRTVLLLGLALLLAQQTYPRAKAAWMAHARATALADYALCMVGPTGPTLMRDDVAELRRLVRRRLVGSEPFERPFDRCSDKAREVTGSDAVARAHSVEAWSFVEYHGREQPAPGQETLASLAVSSRPVAKLSEKAWPFLRGGHERLIKPSPGANEAVHQRALPVPAIGYGLPKWRSRYRAVHKTQQGFLVAIGRSANLTVYESRDRGLTWETVSPRRPAVADFAERCPIDAEGRSFAFTSSPAAEQIHVTSLGPDGAPYATRLTEDPVDIVAATCDAEALVAAVASDGSPQARLVLCPFRRRCSALPPPPSATGGLKLPLDVARLSGTTVLSAVSGGIVRVTSTRDDGRTWSPYTVAYDAAEHPRESMDLAPPGRLLALEDTLLLYGGGSGEKEAYLVLVSDDQGASWRGPRER